MEDNVAGSSIVNSIQRLIADQFGYDVEELMVNGDTASGDDYLALLNGWLKQAQNGKLSASGIYAPNAVDGSAQGQDYQEIFRVLLSSMPDRFRRRLDTDGRFYIPKRTEVKYRDELAARGTPLGDLNLTGKQDLTYQGIKIVGVPNIKIDANGNSKILLCNRNNLYAGYHRAVRFETWRDPREGLTSFVVTTRVDAQVAVPNATCLAYNVDVSV
jgi:HK97 family phage major capsid protein